MKKKSIIAAAAVVAVILLVSVCLLNNGLFLEKTEKEIVVSTGMTDSQVIEMLHENGIISNKTVMKIINRIYTKNAPFKVGSAVLSSKMGYTEIINILRNDMRTDVKVTIPEGYNLDEIAEVFAFAGADKDKFYYELEHGQFDYDFVKDLPAGKTRLEGYLFPDTYFIEIGMSEHDMIDMCLKQFDKVYTEEYRTRAKELGMTDHEIMTLASIIEKECKTDREIVSSVFHNRLNSPQFKYLESCATVIYVTRQPKDRLTYADINVKSPYNTYITPGLPPGPIASPGAVAIHAALYPAESEYYYFSDAGDGTNSFSKTYEEHLSKNP
ncbi:MAG: endolytic transglycosylase MltG [Clostridia bacterium]|nr:endolytic transglycosylase MltG [Clostridia bacterium]